MNLEKFQKLISLGLSLDHIFLLEQLEKGLDICSVENTKIQALYQALVRKNLVVDCKVAKDGEEVLKFIGEKEELELVPRKKKNDDFDLWWEHFPGTDTFIYKGRTFKGSRALRAKKEDCKAKFIKILAEGFTAEELIKALEYEINQKKEMSFKTGENKLKFMQNSSTYLNQRTWEPYVELVRQGMEITETQNGVDI